MSSSKRDDLAEEGDGAKSATSDENVPMLRDVSMIEDEWREFVDGLATTPGLRDVIKQSWLRSREYGVDPIHSELRRIDDEELGRRLEQNRALIEIAKPHLEWLSVALHNVDHGLYVTDRDGIILCSAGNSEELRDRYGLRPGYDWSEATMGTNGAGTALAAAKPVAIVGPEHFSQNLHRGICTAAPISNADGEVIGAIDISVGMIDGTPRRLAMAVRSAEMIESQLARQISRERLMASRRTLAYVSHEVRTPMTVIETYITILRETIDAPEQFQVLDVIERNSDMMLELFDDLLDLSRVEAGHCRVERSRFALVELLDDVEMMMALRAKQVGVRFGMEVCGDVPTYVNSDKSRVRQILINLVANAIKFTPSGGAVSVGVRLEDPSASRLIFEVEDTGIGLSAEQAEHIFEPFHTKGHGTAVRTEGTGLGLAISRELVNALGGEIEVESILGDGSTFRFSIDNR
jgi:signal transduction histidine kinase